MMSKQRCAARRRCSTSTSRSAYAIVTDTGADAIPFATTTRLLGPAGVVAGSVKSVDDAAPGAIETDVQLLVRAYVTTPELKFVIRTSGKLVLSCTSSP